MLKPCPFCGGEASYWTKGGRYGLYAWAECDVCGAKTKTVTSQYAADDPCFHDTTAYVRLSDAWNRRCNDA